MIADPTPTGHRASVIAGVAGLTLLGLLARLAFFTGLSLGDDVFYGTQSFATGVAGWWPPEPRHWHTRLGMIFPTALSLKLCGPLPLAFVLWPLALSTLAVPAFTLIVRREVGTRAGWLAGLFTAFFPLELIYATHLFPDAPVGLFVALSLYSWLVALRTDQVRWYVASGGFFALGYLCRETVLMDGPVYLALWWRAGRLWRPRLPWVAVIPVLVFAAEVGLFAATTGDPLYRWKGVAAQQADPSNLALIATSQRGGGFWTEPLLLLATSHEFALYLVGAVAAAWGYRRWPEVRPFAVWLAVKFVWTYYGTTVPTDWVPLQRDPRYAAALELPVVLLLARALVGMPPGWRVSSAALLIIAGLIGASLDQGNTVLHPHRAFLESPYASEETSLDPFEYYGSRWVRGLAEPVPFACATDRGRPTTLGLIPALPGAVLRPSTEGRYLVVSPTRTPEIWNELRAAGWAVEAEFPGRPTFARQTVAQLLAAIPSQRERAARILKPPGLVVLRKP